MNAQPQIPCAELRAFLFAVCEKDERLVRLARALNERHITLSEALEELDDLKTLRMV